MGNLRQNENRIKVFISYSSKNSDFAELVTANVQLPINDFVFRVLSSLI